MFLRYQNNYPQNNAQHFKMKPYRYPYSHKNEIEKQVREILEAGIIQNSNSLFASSVLLVKKKDETWCFYIDFRNLYDVTTKDKYSMPNTEELLDEPYGSKLYTKINLRPGYHRIRVKPTNIHKTTFQTHQGYYESLSCPLDS